MNWTSNTCYCMHAQLLSRVWLFCDPRDYGPTGSSVHGIFQARLPEWVAMPSSRGSSRSRDWNHVSCISCTGRPVLCHVGTVVNVTSIRVNRPYTVYQMAGRMSIREGIRPGINATNIQDRNKETAWQSANKRSNNSDFRGFAEARLKPERRIHSTG